MSEDMWDRDDYEAKKLADVVAERDHLAYERDQFAKVLGTVRRILREMLEAVDGVGPLDESGDGEVVS